MLSVNLSPIPYNYVKTTTQFTHNLPSPIYIIHISFLTIFNHNSLPNKILEPPLNPPQIITQTNENYIHEDDLNNHQNLEFFQMGSPQKTVYPFFILFILLSSITNYGFSADNTNLVYKGCADQKFPDPAGAYSQSLNSLFDSLTSQSSSAKFYKTSSGQGQSAISGLFQCRGDLSNDDCSNCVKKIPDMAQKLCGKAIAVRVQLGGCYLRYEVSGFRQVDATELLFKICGSIQASGAGFQDRLDTALGQIAKGVGGSGNGFYAGGYQSVYVLGQCEGDLTSDNCVDCVKTASQRAKSECGITISAQIYLQQCYISYTYYPSGVPTQAVSSSSSGGPNAQKTVAIVLGGIVGLGLVLACLMFIISTFKKQSRSKFGGRGY